MIERTILVTLFWLIYFIISFISYYIPEKLVRPFNYFDVKPFNCRICLTTWSLLISYISFSFIYFNWWFISCGILITLMTTIALWYTQKEKTIE